MTTHRLAAWLGGALVALLLSPAAARGDELPTREKPLIVDQVGRRVLVYTEVNELYLYQPTVHWGVVFKDGSYGDRAILKAWGNHLDFHDALVAIGARAGNNLRWDSVGKYVEGDELEVTATWPGLGQELPLEKILSESTGKGFKIRFGGNRKWSKEKHTGCITCLESCWISIASNARYPLSKAPDRFLKPHSFYKGRAEVLPAKDQSPVVLIYRVKAPPGSKGAGTHLHR